MTLITLLLGLLLEHFIGPLERFRRFGWFHAYAGRCQQYCGGMAFWEGPLGVLLVIVPPMLLFWLILLAVNQLSLLLGALTAFLIFVYCLGPRDLAQQAEDWLRASERHDQERLAILRRQLVCTLRPHPPDPEAVSIPETLLVHASDRLFALIFWFVLLGPFGALLFRLASELRRDESGPRQRGFAASADDLYAILDWIPARLLALGFALAGSLTHALEAWRFPETMSLHDNQSVLRHTGMAALQLDQGIDERGAIEAVLRLIRRTLTIWLTFLAVMTLGGWMG